MPTDTDRLKTYARSLRKVAQRYEQANGAFRDLIAANEIAVIEMNGIAELVEGTIRQEAEKGSR